MKALVRWFFKMTMDDVVEFLNSKEAKYHIVLPDGTTHNHGLLPPSTLIERLSGRHSALDTLRAKSLLRPQVDDDSSPPQGDKLTQILRDFENSPRCVISLLEIKRKLGRPTTSNSRYLVERIESGDLLERYHMPGHKSNVKIKGQHTLLFVRRTLPEDRRVHEVVQYLNKHRRNTIGTSLFMAKDRESSQWISEELSGIKVGELRVIREREGFRIKRIRDFIRAEMIKNFGERSYRTTSDDNSIAVERIR